MNNDLKKEAVVDTGKSSTAAAKKKTSGQSQKPPGKKSSNAKSSAEKNKSASAKKTAAKPVKKLPDKKNYPQKKPANYSEEEEFDKKFGDVFDDNTEDGFGDDDYEYEEDDLGDDYYEDKKDGFDDDYYEDEEDDLGNDDYEVEKDELGDDYYEDEEDELGDDYYEDEEDELGDDYYEEDGDVKPSEDIVSDNDHRKRKRRPLFVAVPIVTAAVILTAGVIISSSALGIFDSAKHEAFVATEQSNAGLSSPQGKFLDGVSVQGVDLGGLTMTQAQDKLALEESRLIPSINYTLTCHDKIVYLTEDDFEFDFDTVKVLNEAYEYSEYMREVLMDKGRANLKNSEKKNFPISMTFNESSIRTACEEVAKKVNVDMENAHVTNINTEEDYLPDMFSFAEGVVGYSVDVDDLVTQISTLKKNDNYSADIIGQMTVVEPKTNLDDLLKNLVLISKYETYSGNTWEGNMNMTVAMQSMTGSVIKPGEVFSFNGKTGDSNLPENGYYSAGVIVNGTSANGVGGGICQAATTIYNAAIRAGMTIVEREPHTWPSTYVPVGIDSAIDYGAIDMKFRNDTEHEVYLICYMEGATLHAYIYGYKPDNFDEIVVSSWFTGASGIGFGAGACRNYYKDGKLVKTEDLPGSFYSNGGGTSYAYDEPLSNYVFERVYTDKQAAKLADKIEAETKNNVAKITASSDTDKDSDKEKTADSDKDTETSDSTATNDIANNTPQEINEETVTTNAVIEEYEEYTEPIVETAVIDDTIYSDETVSDESAEDTFDELGIDEDDVPDEFEDFEE